MNNVKYIKISNALQLFYYFSLAYNDRLLFISEKRKSIKHVANS